MELDAAGPGAAKAPRRPAASDLRLARVVREEAGRIVATLTASLGNLDVAEEAVAQAVEEALREWRVRGIPPKPGAWLTQAARHNALDRLRREHRYRAKLALLAEPAGAQSAGGVDADAGAADEADERVPLLFGCCHPALSPDAQLALTLRAVCGLTTAQIARATLSTEAATAQRIVRAKRKIGAAGIPIRVPEGDERRERLDVVLTIVSVMYSEAHLVAGADAGADRDLADDAVWLARVVAAALPRDAEAHGLLSLLLFHRAREDARAVDGELVLLDDQDRSRWDSGLLQSARAELERAAILRRPGRWQLHAAIAACHADAAAPADADWLQVLTLYDMLLAYDASPIVRLNRAVALARVEGPEAALAELDELGPALEGFHLWHAVRASALRDAGRADEALAADLRALELTANEAERRLIMRRLGRRAGTQTSEDRAEFGGFFPEGPRSP
jgi:RNA polymerase sigma-70 factor (ECF subfamily)